MKKNFALFHGTLSPNQRVDNYFWMPWLMNGLHKQGHIAWMPELPDGENPERERWLRCVLDTCPFEYDEQTTIVTHSAGGPLALSLLEKLTNPVGRVIMVAGFWRSLPNNVAQAVLQERYNWNAIRANCKQFFIVNSDNDPWGCNDEQGREMLKYLGGGTLIVPSGAGHMGSISHGQPYCEFPLITQLATM